MEFRVCFTIANYENNIFSLCEICNALIDAFCYSKIHFHQSGPFKLIKDNVEIFTYFVSGIVIQRVVTRKGLPSVQ